VTCDRLLKVNRKEL